MSDQSPSPRATRVRAFVAGALVVIALVFVFQNTESRRVHFLFWSMSMPTWIWLLIIFLVGAVAGSMFPWLRRRRR